MQWLKEIITVTDGIEMHFSDDFVDPMQIGTKNKSASRTHVYSGRRHGPTGKFDTLIKPFTRRSTLDDVMVPQVSLTLAVSTPLARTSTLDDIMVPQVSLTLAVSTPLAHRSTLDDVMVPQVSLTLAVSTPLAHRSALDGVMVPQVSLTLNNTSYTQFYSG